MSHNQVDDSIRVHVDGALRALSARIDRGLFALLVFEFCVALALAWLWSPYTWAGTDVAPHVHGLATLLIGGSSVASSGYRSK